MQNSALFWKRGIRRGLVSLLRDRSWGMTMAAFVGILFLLQMVLLTAVGVQGVHRLLRQSVDIRLQLTDNATDQQIQEFLTTLRSLPLIHDVRYITREEAFETERRRNSELATFLEEFDLGNPFRDTVAVTLRSLGDYDAFVAFVREERWTTVADPSFLSDVTDQEQEARELLRVTEAGRSVTLSFLGVIALVVLLVTIELTRRRAFLRKDEVTVERLSGAPAFSVLIPFATEAGVLLLLAGLVSVLLLFLFVFLVPILVPSLGSGGPFDALQSEVAWLFQGLFPLIALGELILFPLLGGVGAWVGVRREV